MSEMAVVVTCHASYLRWLPEALASIDRQAPQPAERVLVLDGCGAARIDTARWRTIQGSWHHPAGARNAGLAATRAPWVTFWDVDNVMADGFVAAVQRAIRAAPSDLGILYPDIQDCDERLTPAAYRAFPEWDYWDLRAENCIDTASAWRRDAVDVVGAWADDTGGLDDYALALRITAAGWTAAKLEGPPVMMRTHPGQRHRGGALLTNIWRARSLGIVSLLAGRDDTFARWAGFLLEAELPPRTALYVVDNSGRPEFARMAFDACQRIAAARRLHHLDFASLGRAYRPAADESWFAEARHRHIARLYASVLPRVHEDLVLTLEDDVDPPRDAARRLGEEFGFRLGSKGNVGVAAAAYPMAHDDRLVCASWGERGGDRWGPSVGWEHLRDGPIDVAFVGGGCSMWANWAVRGYPVHLLWRNQLGWDAVLCVALRRRGYRVRLHGAVRCGHHVHGRLRAD
jgi:Glycosyl transferase family 2